MSNTQAEIRQGVCYLSGDFYLVVPTSGYTTTGFIASGQAGTKSDNYFNDMHAHFYVGTNIGTDVIITDYTDATGTFVFKPAVTTVTGTSRLELNMLFPGAEINNQINRAIDLAKNKALEDKIDVTTTLVAATYRYAMPAGFAYVEDITLEDGVAAGTFDERNMLDTRAWSIEGDGTTAYLKLHQGYFGSLLAGRDLQIKGQSIPAAMTSDIGTTNVDKAYLEYQTKALLHQTYLGDETNLGAWHQKQFEICQVLADRAMANIDMQQPRGWKVFG